MPPRNLPGGPGVSRWMGPVDRLAAVLFLTVILAACGPATESSPPPQPVDASGDWVLERGTVNGAAIPLVADYPITFSVDGMAVGGQAACNGYGGRLELVDGQLRLGQMGAEQVLCGEPDGAVMRSEAAFLGALPEVRAARVEDDRLTLLGPAVELVFTRQAPMPMADLVGTDWVLESVTDRGGAAAAIGEPAVLRLDADGTFHGSTGCRTFTGTWVKAAGRLAATQIDTDGECPGGLGGQDGVVVEGLDGALPTIEGERLTLTLNGGVSLVYRRGAE